ncbi:unnamed protein product [Caenorhabditis angaria]|uniref:Zinc metalloproteinase n=1 Tax=Caenorhabditis angaria TaxID=860376 RepID=A0A9P1IFV9_9PELO|nr:unnamed protein product [Caenorhabditis angaria]
MPKNLLLILLILGFCRAAAQDAELPLLAELVNPAQHYQLRDILSTIFDLDTIQAAADSASVSAGDSRQKPEYTDRLSSISELNRGKRNLLFQGDIHLSRDHLANIVREQLNHKRKKRTAFRNSQYPHTIWKPHVPYTFHKSLTPKARASLEAAIQFWHQNTCVNFKVRTTEKVYLAMSGQEDGCWSTVGRDEAQGAQILNIGKGCEMFGVTSHELAHALGLFHEQSRYDRDSYVQIIKSRIARQNFYDFAIVGPSNMDTYNEIYDIGSVMHYRPTEFSQDGGNTINANDVNMQGTMGQFRGPSFLDVKKINKHYECDKICKNALKCANGGYQHPRKCDQCICPTGFGGKTCDDIDVANPAKCRGVLTASEEQRKFTINIKPKATAKGIRQCNYHIQAPEGKKIVIYLDSVIGNCVQGCYEEGVELKMYADKTVTGARFCCKLKKPQILVSQTNLVPIILMAGKAQAFVQLRYSYVDSPLSRSPISASQSISQTSQPSSNFQSKFEDLKIDSEKIRQDHLISQNATTTNSSDFEELYRKSLF